MSAPSEGASGDGISSRRDFVAAIGAAGAMHTMFGQGRVALAPTWTAAGRYASEPNVLGDFLFEQGLIYLNTAALGPAPRQVLDRTMHVWRELESNPSELGYGRLEHDMDDVRATAARFIGCETTELILTHSTTDGMNTVAQGLRLTAGDRVLTSDQEHPGGVSCWKYLARRESISLDVVPITVDEHNTAYIVDRFAAAMTPRTRVSSVSHVLTSTGMRMPIAELSALARRNGALCIVDGAQAVGGIAVNVKALGCHAYATSGHKWLMGPKGTGFLYLAAETKGIVDPMVLEDGHAAYSASSGIGSIPSVMGLGAALDLATQTGVAEVERRGVRLRDVLYESLRTVARVQIVSPPPGPLTAPFLTMRLPDHVESGALRERLRAKHAIVVKVVPKVWLNGLRVSTHVFNTEREVAMFVSALQEELA
ncbi:MAG: aminotransferase class V-fold PLP-dependent enzyme [Gemmatimonadaceae bacterium]